MSHWRLAAPVESVWAELTRPLDWPHWWRGVVAVESLECGDGAGLGACYRMTWQSALPYRLTFDMRTVRIEKPRLIEGVASGELDGVGRWTLETRGGVSAVRYDWQVEPTRRWMRSVTPLLKPVFTWNHDLIMRWGQDGLERRLARGRAASDGTGAREEPSE